MLAGTNREILVFSSLLSFLNLVYMVWALIREFRTFLEYVIGALSEHIVLGRGESTEIRRDLDCFNIRYLKPKYLSLFSARWVSTKQGQMLDIYLPAYNRGGHVDHLASFVVARGRNMSCYTTTL